MSNETTFDYLLVITLNRKALNKVARPDIEFAG